MRKSGDRVRITAQLVSAEDGYHLWSLRTGYLSADERYRIQLYVNNLLDEEYTIDGGNTGGDLGSPTFIAGPPRLYGGEFTWYFR